MNPSAPGTLDEAQGWTVDKKTALASPYKPDTVQPSSTFVTEPSPFGALGYRTLYALNGVFSPGDWALSFKVKCNAYYAQRGYVKYRLWRSANGDGSGATQITDGWKSSAEVGFTGANQYQTGSITWSAGSVALANEYLFLEIEWYATVSGGNNSAAVYWVHNEGSVERLDTPAMTVSVSDTLTTNDSVFRNKGLQVLDGVGLTDSTIRGKILVILDAAALSLEETAISKSKLVEILDSLGVSDSGGISTPERSLIAGDSIGLVDLVLAYKILLVLELLGLSDIISVDRILAILDQLSLSETVLRGKTLELTDALSLLDAVLLNRAVIINDFSVLGDSVLANKILCILDALGLSDQIIRNKKMIVTDALTLSDLMRTSKNLIVTDHVKLSDLKFINKILTIIDAVGISDSIFIISPWPGIHMVLDLKTRDLKFLVIKRSLDVSVKGRTQDLDARLRDLFLEIKKREEKLGVRS